MLQRTQSSDVEKVSLPHVIAYRVLVKLKVECGQLGRTQLLGTALSACVTVGMRTVSDTSGLITAQGMNGHKTDAQPMVLLLT